MKAISIKSSRTPKGRVAWASACGQINNTVNLPHRLSFWKDIPCAILPCRTQRQARALVRWMNMSAEQKERCLAKAIKRDDDHYAGPADDDALRRSNARAIVKALEGK